MGCQSALIYTRIIIYIGTIVLHITNSVVMFNSFQGEAMEIEGIRNYFKLQAFFITCWNFTFQVLYAAFAILCDWMILKQLKSSEKMTKFEGKLLNFRERVFTVFVWPSTTIVFTFFWPFFVYNRNLFYPAYLDKVITLTSNHIMHTLIMPIALLELVLYPRRKPDTHIKRLLCVYGLEAVYLCGLFSARYITGIWVYPIFGKITGTVYLPMFIIIISLALTFYYYTQFCISAIVFNIREKLARKYCKVNCN